MRGISYLLLGAVFIVLIAVASINYFSYAFLSQIPSYEIETINDQFKNEVGIVLFAKNTIFLFAKSGDTINIDALLIVLPDGSIYAYKSDLNVRVTSFMVTALNLTKLNINLPDNISFKDLRFILVDEDGGIYEFKGDTTDLGSHLRSFSNIVTDVPISIGGEWEVGEDESAFFLLADDNVYSVMPGFITINEKDAEVYDALDGDGEENWDVALLFNSTINQEFLDWLKQYIADKINNGEYLEKEVHDDHDDENYTEFKVVVDLSIFGSFSQDTLFIWSGNYVVEVKVRGNNVTSVSPNDIIEIEFEDE